MNLLKLTLIGCILSLNLSALDLNNKEEVKSFINDKKEKCDKNDKKSCYELGDFLLSKHSNELAKEYLSKACNIGSAEACYTLEKTFK